MIVDLSLAPGHVSGTASAVDGAPRAFEGWLGLAQAVASAAGGAGKAPISGRALLGDNAEGTGKDDAMGDGR